MVWISNGDSGSSVRTKLNTIPNDGTTALVPQVITRSTPSATGVVTFSSIPGTYRDLKIEIYGASDAAVTNSNVTIMFNNDSGSNYDQELLQGTSNSTPSANGAVASAPQAIANVPGTSVANAATQATIYIPNYSQTTFQKSAMGQNSAKTGTGAISNLFLFLYGVWWRNTAAITRIDLTLGSGNWASGSTVTLWGYP